MEETPHIKITDPIHWVIDYENWEYGTVSLEPKSRLGIDVELRKPIGGYNPTGPGSLPYTRLIVSEEKLNKDWLELKCEFIESPRNSDPKFSNARLEALETIIKIARIESRSLW